MCFHTLKDAVAQSDCNITEKHSGVIRSLELGQNLLALSQVKYTK